MEEHFSEKIILAFIGIFGGLMTFLQKSLYGAVKSNYDIIVKLIDRFNKSDSRFVEMERSMGESADRRHEKVLSEIDDVTADINFIKGRLKD